MYYPILRGKQNEFLALKDIIEKLKLSQQVIPIIEPVKLELKPLLSCLKELDNNTVSSIVVLNPTHGELAEDDQVTESLIDSILSDFKNVKFGIIIRSTTTLSKIKYYLSLIKTSGFYLFHQSPYQNINEINQIEALSNFNGNLINTSTLPRNYHNNLSQNHALVAIDDPFNKQKRNEDYRLNQDEFFSDMHKNFGQLGFNGFGDYLIIGEEFIEGGRTPSTVALHITYPKTETEIWIRHFLSVHYPLDAKTSNMVLETMSELKSFLDDNPEILEFSTSCHTLLGKGATSLGTLKRHAMSHHMELIMYLLQGIKN
ncbi:sce7725 family protein [Acinetobacter vivianii]|uniref:sce7725 family protein n=1 Tax=Acinetobacter vivianii TaxID=1776742 RepID=UPI004041EBCF